MQFTSVVLFASAALAAVNTTVTETITSCEESGACHTATVTTTYCPEENETVSTYTGGAAVGQGSWFAAGAAAVAAGAMLL